jgi:hypothetical protein
MLKFIIILALIFYVLPRLIKWALKGFIVTQVNKAQQDMRQQQKAYQSQQKREGQIDVDYVPKKMEINLKILVEESMWIMKK